MPNPLESITKALEPLTDQPVARRLLSEASVWRDRTLRAQEATLGALNLPSAADLAKLERRLRALTDGVARLEDHLDRMEKRLRRAESGQPAVFDELRAEVAAMREQLTGSDGDQD